MSEAITPFQIKIPEAQLADLRARLEHARLPEAETVSDWSQGVPLAYVRELLDYWRTSYDWRRGEALLNGFPQFRTPLDGPDGTPLDIHFLHVRSPEPNALPLVMTHGWPGSILEFHKVIGPLTDPRAHGGNPADAFHVVAPALPGYGFSGKPVATGWGVQHTAKAWGQLMRRLGYARYGAQGGDWGAITTTWIGRVDPEGCLGLHINMPIALPTAEDMANLTPRELDGLAAMKYYNDHDSGYSKQQSTRPQTLGYALVDSPVGQMAWIVEKFFQWMDCDGHPENVLTKDELLDNVMLYWLTAAGASSARLSWESFASSLSPDPVTVPSGMSIFPREIFRPSRRWAERIYTDIRHWNELDKGGHFAAFEQPEQFVNEVRTFFGHVR
ncbi:MAG: epoxide hydrolase family protein [Actinomycetota bacterium]